MENTILFLIAVVLGVIGITGNICTLIANSELRKENKLLKEQIESNKESANAND